MDAWRLIRLYELIDIVRQNGEFNHQYKDIKDFSNGTLCNFHRHTPHGLAICYDTDKVAIVEEGFEIEFDQLEIWSIGVKVGKEHVLIVLVYHPSSFPKRLFLDQLWQAIVRWKCTVILCMSGIFIKILDFTTAK